MRFYNYLIEKSYTAKDIPENFYVVFDIEKIFDQLKQRKIKGLKGISSSNEIEFQFLGVARDAMLEMNSKELMNLNDVTRIMYDNPHYLVSKNMWALRRIYQDNPQKWSSTTVNHIFGNLFEYLIKTIKESGKHGEFVHDAEYSGFRNVDYDWAKKIANKLKIRNLKDLAKIVKNYIDNIFYEKMNKSWASRRTEPYDFKLQEIYKYLYETLLEIGRIYSSENEWVVKNDHLKVPKGSNLYLLTPTIENFKEEAYKAVKNWIENNPDKDLFDLKTGNMKFSMQIRNKMEDMGIKKFGTPGKYVYLYEIDKYTEELENEYNVKKIDESEFRRKQSEYFSANK